MGAHRLCGVEEESVKASSCCWSPSPQDKPQERTLHRPCKRPAAQPVEPVTPRPFREHAKEAGCWAASAVWWRNRFVTMQVQARCGDGGCQPVRTRGRNMRVVMCVACMAAATAEAAAEDVDAGRCRVGVQLEWSDVVREYVNVPVFVTDAAAGGKQLHPPRLRGVRLRAPAEAGDVHTPSIPP
eukprot:TRINITY_DN7830_c1_g1_i2.p1 TRINITY_DN7830_c1_g1~~TRINITY_DN7830_c1_g1_i2.p1  ORF type:complete len:207 (+),score=51.27 TRINITY_DN7830_c1_g1_i2:72-623(+)